MEICVNFEKNIPSVRAFLQNKAPLKGVGLGWILHIFFFSSTALSTCLLKELKVTHVLNAAHGKNDAFYGGFVNTSFSNYDAAGIKFMGIPALDTPSFYLRSYFKQAADFIDECLRSKGNNNLGSAGRNYVDIENIWFVVALAY